MTPPSRSSDRAVDISIDGRAAAATTPRLRPHEFRRLRDALYDACGIRLRHGKESLVQARLASRLHDLGVPSYGALLDRVERAAARGDGRELSALIDALTTNQTAFFREPAHFEYLREIVVPALAHDAHPMRIWCAGCATGEEAFTIAMVLGEAWRRDSALETRILATDVSGRALAHARRAAYSLRAVRAVPVALRRRWFARDTREHRYVVREGLRRTVRFARLNLVHDWPMHGPFDAIFCRNVMIYFDAPVRDRLVERFRDLLRPGGHLFIGHSESLGTALHGLRYVQPAVYIR